MEMWKKLFPVRLSLIKKIKKPDEQCAGTILSGSVMRQIIKL